jgi:hypothetical protein
MIATARARSASRIRLPLGARSFSDVARDGAFAIGILLASVLAGMAVLDPRWGVLVLPAVGLAVLVGIAAVSRGALVGFTVLGVSNGIPGLDLESFALRGSFRPSDLLITFLIGALGFWHLTTTSDVAVDRRWQAAIRAWSLVFIGWWLLTFARSALFSDIPPLQAALFGRDFLYFGLLVVLLPVAFRRRRDLVALVAMLAVGGTIFALAQTATSLFPQMSAVFDPRLLINENFANEFEGVTRVYSYMGDVVVLGAIVAAGVAMVGRTRFWRRWSSVLFVILTIGALTQLSRAAYAALLAGLLLVVVAALVRASNPLAVVRRVIPAVVLVAALFPVLSLVHPTETQSVSAAQVFATRAESGIEEIQSRSGTFGYRYNVQSRMLDLVGNRWPIGLGFWHPDSRYVVGLPVGSIRNTDVGVLNGITTIGAIGTGLLYLPVLGTIVFLIRRRRPGPDKWGGFAFGAAGWFFGVVVASISLVTLFTVPGLVLTAVVMVAAVSIATRPDDGLGELERV